MTPESKPLLESGADPDPLGQFGQWFDEAAAVVPHPEAIGPKAGLYLMRRPDGGYVAFAAESVVRLLDVPPAVTT